MVRARFPTGTAIQLKVDFVILSLSETATTDIIYIDVLDLVNKNLSPPTIAMIDLIILINGISRIFYFVHV